ncbi:glycoside hydrolase family 78 protein [Sphingobium sufflavum]|uniref:alpha-L-rhamnosidase n=1 Tax=Sphingobium sufflavum TaxID=1129547 RepID=UPI001F2D54C9|nr:alpha-L-rhamnosidase [Sphingobium sufflavum]MCE7798853.1 glycoside hydrolase family 78 protein [Sphingobium sufflavum]
MRFSVSRRAFLLTSGLSGMAISTDMGLAGTVGAPLKIDAMLIDGVENPVAVHNPRNRFSWQIGPSSTNQRQTSYRIGVASSRTKAEAGEFDLWDSGRIASNRSFDIPYGGKPLVSRQQAWWRVAVSTESGAIAESAIGLWEMGLLEPADWSGEWVAAEDRAARAIREAGFFWVEGGQKEGAGARSFRLPFRIAKSADVTLFIGMSGKAELRLDNQPIVLPTINPNAWGDPQPVRLHHKLRAGDHELLLSLTGVEKRRAAILVRAELEGGKTVYFDGRGAETREGLPSEWTTGEAGPQWTAVAVQAGDPAPLPADGAFLLRRSFAVNGQVSAARLYVTALGVYEAELNGIRLGDALLTPEFTDYRKTLLYRVHDVAASLRQGENVLGGMIAEGWYGSNISPGGRYNFGPAPLRFQAQLEIFYADGRRQTVAGDGSWSIARAPITMATIYDGEDYDARLEMPGWSAPGFRLDRKRWEAAKTVSGPPADCRLTGAVAPPIRRTAQIEPKVINQIATDRAIIDFGQNFAGWVRLKVKGAADQRITLRFAELVNEDGSIDQSNLRGARAADTYVLRGDPAGEIYEPRFTYHGFRYVEIEGLKAPLESGQATGIVIHSDLAQTGDLMLSSYVPQRLWQNGLWSQRSNFVGIPTDCPQRDERLGWMGDAHVFWDAASYNMDVAAFTGRFMRDVADAQHEDGGYNDISPDSADGTLPLKGSSPGWGDAGVILPWTVWWRYGDTAIVDDYWASMTRFMAMILKANPDFLWRNDRGTDYADWLALDAKRPGDPTTPKDLVGTAMWKGAADAMADMAAATGRSQDATGYKALGENIAAAFAKAFVRPDGSLGNGSQTGYILALHFGLVPEAQRGVATGNLVADIRRRGTLLSTGFLGTPYSLDVLANAGETQLVYDLLLRTEFPSWGYMISRKATTIWERWNGDAGDKTMNSFNHYALGAVAGFLWRRIAGIDALSPGFTRFRFNPVYDGRLQKGGGRYRSRSGLISTEWEFGGNGNYRLKLLVPPNSEAVVVLPTGNAATISRNGKKLPSTIKIVREADNRMSLIAGPGEHEFLIERAVS